MPVFSYVGVRSTAFAGWDIVMGGEEEEGGLRKEGTRGDVSLLIYFFKKNLPNRTLMIFYLI